MGNSQNIIEGAATISIDASDLGFTRGGVTVRYEPGSKDINADQVFGTVKKYRDMEKMFVSFVMLELDIGFISTPDTCNSPPNHVVVLTGVGPNCRVRIFSLLKVVNITKVDYKMSKEEETAVAVELECLKDNTGKFGTIQDL